jgi:hypothetical protein
MTHPWTLVHRGLPTARRSHLGSFRTGVGYIYTMNPDGSDQKQVSMVAGGSDAPAWRPMLSPKLTVTVGDSGFVPKNAHIALGNKLQWNFTGTADHAVTDGTGMGVFGSGSEPPGGAYAAGFHSAGTYPVLDPTTLATSTVFVPVVAEPPTGPPGMTFTITWSSELPLPGFVFDVQVKAPGSGSWAYLVKGGPSRSTTVSPNTPGKYKFRARLRTGGAHSGWSPTASITVT